MQLFSDLNRIKKSLPRCISAIGIFDGVHKGHREILRQLVKKASHLKGKSLVITFHPHPLKILRSNKSMPSLISLKHRINLISESGVDAVAVLNFNKKFSRISPEGFVRKTLVDKVGIRALLVGDNFMFGRGRRGKIRLLKELSRELNFEFYRIAPVKFNNRIISSTWIRDCIVRGDLRLAERLLGRKVSVLGTVIKGRRRGRILGFPTANVDPHHEAIPTSGVYAVRVKLQGKLYNGILNIGRRPTFESDTQRDPTIEVHLFGFSKRIYGKDLEILFERKIRPEKKFLDKEKLIGQIKKDVRLAKKTLK